MSSTRKSRKKQTKLSFSPVGPSDRHAYVTYEGSPAKRRRIDEYLQSLPIPSDGPSSSAMRQSRTSPPPSSLGPRDSKNRLSNVKGDQSRQGDDESSGPDSSDSDMSHDSLVLKTPKAKKPSGRSRAVPESSQIFSQPPKLGARFRRSDARHADDNLSSSSSGKNSDSSDDDALVSTSHSPRHLRNMSKGTTKNAELAEEAEDDDEEDIRPSTQRAIRRSRKKAIKPDPDDVIALDDDSEDESEDHVQVSTPHHMDKSFPSSSHPRNTTQSMKEEQDDSENQAVNDEEEEHEEENDDDDDEEEDDIVPISTQRRRRKAETDHDIVEQDEPVAFSISSDSGKKTRDRDKQDEIDEDAEDLKVSTVFREDSSNKKPSKHGQRLQRLQQLKARRGNKSSSPVQIDNDPDSLEEPADDAAALLHYDEDDDELEDWVVDEEDGDEDDIDGDDDADMTDLYLMRHGQLKLKDHWDFVIKWMVSNRLNPGGVAELQPFYRLSIKRVNGECQGLIDRLVSTSWVPAFVWALKARPDYEEAPLEAIEGISMDKCGACNRSNHPPSYVVRLLGPAYNSANLEPLKEDSDGEESVDEEGRKIPGEDRSWYLGTFCRSNAMNAHALIHWRKGLKDWVQLYLKKGGFLKSKEVAKRDSWSASKRGRLVDEIVEELKASGVTKNLWNQFSQKIKSAPNVQGQQYWR